MSDQKSEARFSLKQLMFLVTAAAFAVFLTLIPFPWPVVGFLVTVVTIGLGADRRVARAYLLSSLGAMIVAMAVFLAVCYLRDEQPFNMNKVASNSIISMARKTVFSIGIFFGVVWTILVGRVRMPTVPDKGSREDAKLAKE